MNRLESAGRYMYSALERGLRDPLRATVRHPKAAIYPMAVVFVAAIALERNDVPMRVQNEAVGAARFAVVVADNAWFGARKTFAEGFKVVGEWADPAPKRRLELPPLGISKQY
jgi:hypothetical protein